MDRPKCGICGSPADAVEKDTFFYCAKCWLKRVRSRKQLTNCGMV
jgi:hypothetical protein